MRHQTYYKQQEENIGWDTDGEEGRGDPNNLIIFDWICCGDNYTTWLRYGENNGGASNLVGNGLACTLKNLRTHLRTYDMAETLP